MIGRAVLFLSFGAFASAASLRAVDPLLPLVAGEFGVTAGAAASVITAFSIAYGLLQLVVGPIGDRVGKYRMVVLLCALSALGCLACAAAPSLGLLIAARFAAGAAVGPIVSQAMAWIGDAVPYERRQAVLARFLIGHMLGVAFGTAGSGALGEWLGWRAIFVALALLYAATATLLWSELRRNPHARDANPAAGSFGAALRRMGSISGSPWVRVILAVVFVEGALFYGALAFVPFYLHQRFGAGVAASGALAAVFAAGGLVYAAAASRIVPRLGERGLALGGGAALALGYLGLLAAPRAAFAIPCMFAVGIGLYMLHNTLQVNATQMAPQARGAAVALFACFLFSGQSLGVWLASRLVDGLGVRPVFAVAGLGLPLLAAGFARRLARRGAPTG
ncbi:MAG TPA: MFS transporter [Burkholderiales bacterium]|nr:MFS transporter [Burkholderiales bacterium]